MASVAALFAHKPKAALLQQTHFTLSLSVPSEMQRQYLEKMLSEFRKSGKAIMELRPEPISEKDFRIPFSKG